MERKLTAILSADVKGYSRLMREDETATVRTLTAYRELMTSLIRQHRGRVVDTPGDNLLAEFASVVDAVQCAAAIQWELRARNAELPDHRKMEFRIGINLGDVIVEGERIYGDGVNIAARVEGLADGGGICVSGSAHEQIEGKLALGYEYLGEHTVKNIEKPVRVYRVRMEPGAAAPKVRRAKGSVKRWHWAAMAAVAVLVVGAGAVAVWNVYLRSLPPDVKVASDGKMALALPEEPSIAVLPFENMSGDPEQEYFSDGITDGIITQLYKIPGLFVIARTSSFTYKGKAVKVQQVGQELGVRYVLEGSVQKAGNRIRVNAQLIEAVTGKHVWAERYDRQLKDLFAVQDGIIHQVVTELGAKLSWYGEEVRSITHATDNYQAADYYLRADTLFSRFEQQGNTQARELLLKAIELDPKYSRAIAFLGWTHMIDVLYGWAKDVTESSKQAEELANKSLAINDREYLAHALLSRIYTQKRLYERAIAEGKRAVEAEPNNSVAYIVLAITMVYAGQPAEGLGLIRKAMRLSPYPAPYYYLTAGQANYLTGRYEEAIAAYKKYLHRQPHGGRARNARQWLIASHMQVGREAEARAEAAAFLEQAPNLSVTALVKDTKRLPFKDYKFLDRQVELLRQAGVPE